MRDKVTDEEKYDFKGGTHQRVNGLWFRIEGNAIVDHDQYRHDLEERSRLSTPAPSPASVQSEVVVLAELVKIGGASWDNEKIQRAEAMIESDRAAQRQIGREEAKAKIAEMAMEYNAVSERYACKELQLSERYAAVVEALRLAEWYINDGSVLPADKNHPYYKVSEAIEKALSDLEPSAPQDAQEKSSQDDN